ncbi:MAG: thioredoxin [Verrucomicrobia bacterium]|nr:thioredoxin [Verrucomicrobiota bacterium]
MASANIVKIGKDNWQSEVVESPTPILVDFWAEWCGPCIAIGPVLDQIADERVGTFRIGKVNVDQSPEIAQQFGIRSIPTLLIFKEGTVAEQMVGAMSKAALDEKIEAYV